MRKCEESIQGLTMSTPLNTRVERIGDFSLSVRGDNSLSLITCHHFLFVRRVEERCRTLTRCPCLSRCVSSRPLWRLYVTSHRHWGRPYRSPNQTRQVSQKLPTVRRRLTIFPSRSDLFLTGPVFVEFPIDVLYSYQLVQREVGVKSGGGFVQKIINM